MTGGLVRTDVSVSSLSKSGALHPLVFRGPNPLTTEHGSARVLLTIGGWGDQVDSRGLG